MSRRAEAPGQTEAAPPAGPRRALVTGWFSFVDGEATAGDLMSAAVAADWLEAAGIEHHTVLSPILGPGQSLDDVGTDAHSHLVFVCGPLAGHQVQDLAGRFRGVVTIALGVSVVDAAVAQSFDMVIPRDGPDGAHPDLAFAARPAAGPVVGVVRANQQPEYQASAHDRADMVIDEVLDSHSARLRPIDTRVDPRIVGQRSAAEVESQFAGLDAVVTTRLHGLVLGLRCGVPVVAVDPIPGGAKGGRPGSGPRLASGDGRRVARPEPPGRHAGLLPVARGAGAGSHCPGRRPPSPGGHPRPAPASLLSRKIAVPRGTPIAHAGSLLVRWPRSRSGVKVVPFRLRSGLPP